MLPPQNITNNAHLILVINMDESKLFQLDIISSYMKNFFHLNDGNLSFVILFRLEEGYNYNFKTIGRLKIYKTEKNGIEGKYAGF
jgi:hypothetical protein